MGNDQIGPKEAQRRALREARFEANQKAQLKNLKSTTAKVKPPKVKKRGRSR
jgi:hypothetical protein